MRAWRSVGVPDLAGTDDVPTLKVRDTATGLLRPAIPADGRTARMYVCGITPYDATHMGHAATYVAFDLLRRAWLDAGYDVLHVQNITDVDDPLLERATATGVDWQDLATSEIALFGEDMEALRVLAPTSYIGAVESIPTVIELIQQLQDRGAIYELDGDLYFSVHTDDRFGSVSNYAEDEMRRTFGERGGDPDRPGKKHPLDCLVWSAQRPGEPAWESPFGLGRPGWHIECTAIALAELGERFDVQGGGSDLVFPHHEMCASEAQSAFTGLTFAENYVHAGMVGYHGEKMSKSLGNLVKVSALRRDGVDPNAIRVALLSHHYQDDWEWTDDAVDRAGARLELWRSALGTATEGQAQTLRMAIRTALANNLDAPAALSVLDSWAAAFNIGDGSGADSIRAVLDARLGILL